jgi:hypothetical protein
MTPDGVSCAAGTCASKTFLLERFLTGSADFCAGFGASSSSTDFCQEANYGIMDSLRTLVEFKAGIIENVFPDFFALDVDDVNISGHIIHLFLFC